MKRRPALALGVLESIQSTTPDFTPPQRNRRAISVMGWLLLGAFLFASLAHASGNWS